MSPVKMKMLLLCLGLTLVWAHEEGHHDVVTSNFDPSKVELISGNWYSVLLASDKMENIEENGSFRIFVEYFQALDSSTLSLSVTLDLYAQRHTHTHTHTHIYIYDGYNTFHIIEAVYDEYAFFVHREFQQWEKKTQVMELYGREPDLGHEIKTWFGEICQEYGIPKENILFLFFFLLFLKNLLG
uniref:Lipocalin/cytosolic fatty-acid binding domain-containing protein n=1 Tax=Rhinolophus ferrumequinum TaxID=59479 RepID=A0A671F129_RHIFE